MLKLASGSPRRRELLALLGVPLEHVPADVDELAAASPAAAKVDAVARAGDAVIGADTEVYLDGRMLGKPPDAAAATDMLRALAGREHLVRTEVALAAPSGRRMRFAVSSRVTMRPRDDDAIAAYVATGEPLDKAGAYALQGLGGRLVASYEGCYANIMGLPLCHAYFALRRIGVHPLERPEPAFERRFGFTCPAWRAAYRQGRNLRDGAEYESWLERLP